MPDTQNKLVFVNGCFDILHVGHIELFKYARSLGSKLVVAIDSDRRVKESKGASRPINNSDTRRTILLSIRYIDAVYIFDSSDELTNLIKELEPDIMVVGSDWKNKKVIGSEYAKEVKFFKRIPEYSTTKTIERIVDR